MVHSSYTEWISVWKKKCFISQKSKQKMSFSVEVCVCVTRWSPRELRHHLTPALPVVSCFVCFTDPWIRTKCCSTGDTRRTRQSRFFTWKGRKWKRKEITNRPVGQHISLSLFVSPSFHHLLRNIVFGIHGISPSASLQSFFRSRQSSSFSKSCIKSRVLSSQVIVNSENKSNVKYKWMKITTVHCINVTLSVFTVFLGTP